MAVNQVIYGDNTLIDLTNDTVSEDKVAKGITFHSADGEQKVGSAEISSSYFVVDEDGRLCIVYEEKDNE